MFAAVKDILFIVSGQQTKLLLMLFMSVALALMEVIGIGLVIPFLGSVFSSSNTLIDRHADILPDFVQSMQKKELMLFLDTFGNCLYFEKLCTASVNKNRY